MFPPIQKEITSLAHVEADVIVCGKYTKQDIKHLLSAVKAVYPSIGTVKIIAVMLATVTFNNEWFENVAWDSDIDYIPAFFNIDEAIEIIEAK